MFLWTQSGLPQNSDPKADTTKSQTQEASDTLKGRFLKRNKAISEKVDQAADDLDVYLAGDEYTKKENRTQVILRNGVDWSEGGVWDYSPHLDVSLHLPNVERKWKLRFTSYDPEEEEQGIERRRLRQRARREDYGASLILLEELGDFDVEFRPRVEISDGLEITHLLRLSTSVDINKVNIAERIELFGRPETGTGQLAGIDLTYHFTPQSAVSLVNEEEYVDKGNLFSTNHGLWLTHLLNTTMKTRTGVLFESDNQPHFRMEQYSFFTSFSHEVLRQALHYKLTPRLAFPREESFSGHAGLYIEIDVLF